MQWEDEAFRGTEWGWRTWIKNCTVANDQLNDLVLLHSPRAEMHGTRFFWTVKEAHRGEMVIEKMAFAMRMIKSWRWAMWQMA